MGERKKKKKVADDTRQRSAPAPKLAPSRRRRHFRPPTPLWVYRFNPGNRRDMPKLYKSASLPPAFSLVLVRSRGRETIEWDHGARARIMLYSQPLLPTYKYNMSPFILLETKGWGNTPTQNCLPGFLIRCNVFSCLKILFLFEKFKQK